MKPAVRFIVCAAMLVGLLFCAVPAAHAVARDGYEILNYDVNAVISKDNVYDITETLKVDIVDQGKHGIYRTIPLNTEMTRTSGGKTYTNTVNTWVTDISVDGCAYHTENGDNAITIWLGSADKFMFGQQDFRIHYKLHFGDDRVRDFDEVYFNIIGDEWTSMTDKLTFSVKLPLSFDHNKLGFAIGYSGDTGYDPADLTYKISGDTITGEVNRPLYAYEAVTMRLELPDDTLT